MENKETIETLVKVAKDFIKPHLQFDTVEKLKNCSYFVNKLKYAIGFVAFDIKNFEYTIEIENKIVELAFN